MLVGAWGEQAIELLESAAARAGTPLERAGELAVTGVESARAGDWRCWVAGRLTGPEESTEPNAIAAQAHARLGMSACGGLRGTFVVVAGDQQRKLATVTRDQLGGRPLVYTLLRDGVVFAEHERDILALLPSTPSIDRLALVDWIERGTLPRGHTLYAGLKRLPPAHRLVLTPGHIEVECYWRASFEGTGSGSRAQFGERLRTEAFAAVARARTGAQRPALRLSGGLDSACVAAGLAAQSAEAHSSEQLLALAAVFPEQPEVDERELIRATAHHTGLALEEIAPPPNGSLLAPALEHIERWRLPPATPNLFIWKPVMSAARARGVDVMLDGEGGDELFGLAPLLIADELRAGKLLAAWSLSARIPGMGAHPDARMRARALRVFGIGGLLPDGLRRRRRKLALMRSDPTAGLLRRADALELVELDSDYPSELDGPHWWRGLARELLDGGDLLNAPAHLQRESIDEQIDRRHPFMFDLELVQTVLSTPPQLQFDPLRDRALLRDALSGYIPEAIRTRHAKSFFTPLLLTALAREGQPLIELLRSPDAPLRAYVQEQTLDRLLQENSVPQGGSSSSTAAARRLWQLGMTNAWLLAQQRPEHPSQLLAELANRGSG